ncbi:MAG: DUF4381 family protein [Planctomycetes bacterium]|nr:DUF4381 family protein [Planctomycetota bacterium]
MRTAARTLVLFTLAACTGPESPWKAPPTQAVDLVMSVSAARVGLLEPFVVQLDLWRRDGVEVDFAPAVEAKDFRAETKRAPDVALPGGTWRRTTLVLRPVRGPAEIVLPPFTAKSKDGAAVATTPETKITVVTALEGKGAAIEAPGEPFPTPSHASRWLVAGVAAAVLAAAGVWWWRRRPRQARHAEEVAVPPHVKALRALARLRDVPRASPAQVEAFYVEVSNVLRTYLEERFGLRAPERTTEEFLRELEGGEQLAREHRAELERFLSQCDLVKFAAFVPGEGEHLAVHALALAFVESTRPDRSSTAAAPQAVHA